MKDVYATIQPKSDQLNAEDLLGGPRDIKVTEANLVNNKEQPLIVNFEGDNGRPYKPNKTMRRILYLAWGNDHTEYGGGSITLYRDPTVMYGKEQVGGICISHITGITEPLLVSLTVRRGKRKLYKVEPLIVADEQRPKTDFKSITAAGDAAAAQGIDAYKDWFQSVDKSKFTAEQKEQFAKLHEAWKKSAEQVESGAADDDECPL